MQPFYSSLDRLLLTIAEPNRNAVLKIVADHRTLFQTVPGATNNHQNWPGGYFDHVQEVLNIAVLLYGPLSRARPLPFSLSDALLVLFLHDIEKPWKYERREDGQLHVIPELVEKQAQHAFRATKLAEYGIVLTDLQQNALHYVEGEMADYSSRRRVMNELAAFCHLCDTWSARGWYSHPLESGDPWAGASRVRDAVC